MMMKRIVISDEEMEGDDAPLSSRFFLGKFEYKPEEERTDPEDLFVVKHLLYTPQNAQDLKELLTEAYHRLYVESEKIQQELLADAPTPGKAPTGVKKKKKRGKKKPAAEPEEPQAPSVQIQHPPPLVEDTRPFRRLQQYLRQRHMHQKSIDDLMLRFVATPDKGAALAVLDVLAEHGAASLQNIQRVIAAKDASQELVKIFPRQQRAGTQAQRQQKKEVRAAPATARQRPARELLFGVLKKLPPEESRNFHHLLAMLYPRQYDRVIRDFDDAVAPHISADPALKKRAMEVLINALNSPGVLAYGSPSWERVRQRLLPPPTERHRAWSDPVTTMEQRSARARHNPQRVREELYYRLPNPLNPRLPTSA